MTQPAKITTVIRWEYFGSDTDDYNDAMNEAQGLADSIGVDLEAAFEHVRFVEVRTEG